MTNIEIGSRIKLIYTDAHYTNLRHGDLGTVRDITTTTDGQKQFVIDWDSGSKLVLLEGIDQFELLSGEAE
jgi:hypothetical protein